MAATLPDPARFVPPYPPRTDGPVPVWRGLIGERARTAVYGWSSRAFDLWHMKRKVMGYTVHIPLHPDLVQQVLLDNASAYQKPDIVKTLLAPTVGRGLLSADGALWREQRRIVAARFTPGSVEALLPVFRTAAAARQERWRSGSVVDVAKEATATTMQVIAETLFGGDRRLVTAEAMNQIEAALGGVSEARLQALLGLPFLVWSPKTLAGRRGQKFLRRTLGRIVAERLERPPRDDFLGSMIAALQERFPPSEARALAIDNAATFYLAGHETTANALTWTLFLLAEQPEHQEKLAQEAVNAMSDASSEALTSRLPRLRLFLEESLRLYPPVPRFDRQAIVPDRLGDHRVEPGDIISIWPWLIHRHRRLWEDPDAFVFDRFAQGERHRFQFLPFGGGPRLCVGARFAMTEALCILACWLAAWRFSPLPGRQVQLSGLVTLRPKNGLPLRIETR